MRTCDAVVRISVEIFTGIESVCAAGKNVEWVLRIYKNCATAYLYTPCPEEKHPGHFRL